MTARRCAAIASTAVATAVAPVATSGRAETIDPSMQSATPTISRAATSERPRGVVEDCSRISGVGRSRDFTNRRNLVVGPLALLNTARTLPFVLASDRTFGSNKLFVIVRGGHRVTLELSRGTRRDVGLAFGPYPDGEVRLWETRRVVTFVACRRGEYPWRPPPDGWPVSGWVGGLLARSPRCVPLRVWLDAEPSPRRAIIRFGVRSCA